MILYVINFVHDNSKTRARPDEKRLFLNSDDCCDCERITIEDDLDGTLAILRRQFRSQEPSSVILEEEKESEDSEQMAVNLMSIRTE